MLLNIPQHTGQPPTMKNYPARRANSARVEKLWFRRVFVFRCMYQNLMLVDVPI